MPDTACPLLEPPLVAEPQSPDLGPQYPVPSPLVSEPSSPPALDETSFATQTTAHMLGCAFIHHLLEAPDHQGQLSATRNRYPSGKYAPGLAIRWLRSEGLIASVGFAKSKSRAGKGHIEHIWRLLDPATAQAWLDCHPWY